MSPHLASGDLAKFYGDARKLVEALNVDNVVLSDLDGQQLINTLLPYGASLPRHGGREQLQRVIETRQPSSRICSSARSPESPSSSSRLR